MSRPQKSFADGLDSLFATVLQAEGLLQLPMEQQTLKNGRLSISLRSWGSTHDPFNSEDSANAAYHFAGPKDTGRVDLTHICFDFVASLRKG